MSEWDAQELPAAHPTWTIEPNETADDRRRRLKLVGDHFWRLAVEWTRRHGPICDLRLRGHAIDDLILFEAGKRCNLAERPETPESPAPAPAGPRLSSEGLSPREREREREFAAAREGLLSDVHQIHRTYGDLLQERDDVIRTLQDTTRTLPTLFGAASSMVKDSISFQTKHVRELIENATGTREFEVRAFAERQRSFRHDRTLGFMIDAFTAGVGSLGPLVAQVIRR